MRRAKSITDGERLEDDPLGDPIRRVLCLGVGFGAELPCEGETPSRDVLVFPRDELSRALCATCLGVAASFLMQRSITKGNRRHEGNRHRRMCENRSSLSKVVLRTVKG